MEADLDQLTADRIEALKRIRRRGGVSLVTIYEEPEMARLFGTGFYDAVEATLDAAAERVEGLPGVDEAVAALRASREGLAERRHRLATELGISERALIAREDQGLRLIARALYEVIEAYDRELAHTA